MTFFVGRTGERKGKCQEDFGDTNVSDGLDKWSLPGGNGESVLCQRQLEQTYRSTKVEGTFSL